MRLMYIACAVLFLTLCVYPSCAFTLTFDDIPKTNPNCYTDIYGVSFDADFEVADHTGSTWGPAHSGSKVLICNTYASSSSDIWLCDISSGAHTAYASSISAYFSTKPGAILTIKGYHYEDGSGSKLIASTTIGTSGESWNNEYVQLSSENGINYIQFIPVTTDALQSFCVDDLSVNFVPEPASILGLLTGLAGIGGIAWRKR